MKKVRVMTMAATTYRRGDVIAERKLPRARGAQNDRGERSAVDLFPQLVYVAVVELHHTCHHARKNVHCDLDNKLRCPAEVHPDLKRSVRSGLKAKTILP